MKTELSPFQLLRSINVNDRTEKKGNLTYLSWAWAVDQLLLVDPSATWHYSEPKSFGDTLMVFCTVKAFGKELTSQLPVMDHKNRAIPSPDAFQVNTAMQRCLAKAIALHGLGLYIYAGEDLPQPEVESREQEQNEFAEVGQKLMASENLADDLKRLPEFFGGDKEKATRFWQAHGKAIKGASK